MKLTLASVASLLGIVALLVGLDWHPVLHVEYDAHVGKFENDRLDRLCTKCVNDCMTWCPTKVNPPEGCLEFCRRDVCQTECLDG